MIPKYYSHQKYMEEVIRICFDQKCLEKMTPGLKLIYAQTDPSVFVNIEDRKSKIEKELTDC